MAFGMTAIFLVPALAAPASGVAKANHAIMSVSRVAPSLIAATREDEGIRFSCHRREVGPIRNAMTAYLRDLGIPGGLVAVSERPAQGALVYTLATSPHDTSTLDLADRPEFGIVTERPSMEIQPEEPRSAPHTAVTQKEILLALMQHGRLTELKGPDCSVQVLAQHVALRRNIVAWAEWLRWGWPNGGPAEWNPTYWDRGTPRAGVPVREAIDDVFTNQKAYTIGCYTATKLVMVKALLDFYGRVRPQPAVSDWIQGRLLSDHEPLCDVEPPVAWSFEPDFDPKDASRPGKLLSIVHGVSPKNFVPGDWAYLLNTDPVSSQKVGYEGSNAVYLGGGRFDDYYGENNHAFTYAEKLDEVFQWRNGVFSRRRDSARRQPLTPEDLEQLGDPPGKGGLVEAWRIVPQFFGSATSQVIVSRLRKSSRRSEPLRLSAVSAEESGSLSIER
ncbi:MAG: hypothetical protein ABSB49_12270 [Polyangia bacterium]